MVQTTSRKPIVPSEREGSSETIRQATFLAKVEEIVRAAWRHAEAGRNDQPADADHLIDGCDACFLAFYSLVRSSD